MYLLKRGPKDLVELTTYAQKYLIAHKEQLGKSKATVQPKHADQKKSTQSKPDSSQGGQRLLQCYRCQGFGHRQSECGTKISPGKDQKGPSTLVSQSSQKKACAMVAQLHEDGEKACTCVEVEETRSKRNLKKRGTEGSTISDRAVYSAVCRPQSDDGQTYVGVGNLNGGTVKVLRDTGCTLMILDRALVLNVMVIPGSSGWVQMVDHTLIDVSLASVFLDSLHYKGHCRVMCVSCSGLVERWNGSLKSMLKRLCHDQPKQWHRLIKPVLFAYREVPKKSTGFNPFQLLYGSSVRGPGTILKELWPKEVNILEVK